MERDDIKEIVFRAAGSINHRGIEITEGTNIYKDLDFDSLDFVEFVMEIELILDDAFDISHNLDNNELEQFKTLKEFIDHILWRITQ